MNGKYTFEQGESVLIHSLDDSGKEYRATVCGISVDDGDRPMTIYIVHLIDKLDSAYKFTHCTMPAACLKREY